MVSVFLKCGCGYERVMDHGVNPMLALPLYQNHYRVCNDCQEVKSVRRPIAENIRLAIDEKEALNLDPEGESFEAGVSEMSLAELKALLASSSARGSCPDCGSHDLSEVEYGSDYTIACPRCQDKMAVQDVISVD